MATGCTDDLSDSGEGDEVADSGDTDDTDGDPTDGDPTDGDPDEYFCGDSLPGDIPADCLANLEEFIAATTNPQDDAEWTMICQAVEAASDDAIMHSSEDVTEPSAGDGWATFKVLFKKSFVEMLPDEAFEGAERTVDVDFPCGDGPFGHTVCANPTWPGGEALILGGVMQEDIPLAHAENSHQYGFVFDSDDNTTNNYEPGAPFVNDLFTGTDLWYQATYAPGAGWGIQVDTAFDGVVQSANSAARIVIMGDAILAIIPASELAAPCPRSRITAFTHTGDFGLQPPHYWSGDTEPTVVQALDSFCQ